MDVISQTADALDLASVKQHLNVDFTEDDVLIQSYIDASLMYVQGQTHRGILETYYTNTTDEFIPVAIDGVEYYVLRVPYRPDNIFVFIQNLPTVSVFPDEVAYNIGTGKLYIPATYDGATKIDVTIGRESNDTPLVNQARLMIVANWYAFRESDFVGSIKEVPTGVQRILDNVSNPQL